MDPTANNSRAIFRRCTQEQKKTLALVADGHTTDEIAYHLSISVSAAEKRIATLRRKLGGITKAEVGRLYREYISTRKSCGKPTGGKMELPPTSKSEQIDLRNFPVEKLELADSVPFTAQPSWASRIEPQVVPEVLEGSHSSFVRIAVSVGLAFGILVMALVLLAVADALADIV